MSASFRFFLTTPLFGVAAGLLLAWDGPDALISRWSPTALALTHLLTAGFLLQAMCGALLQFIPVATGANVWRPLALANLIHPALVGGAVMLAWSLRVGDSSLLPIAELLLGAGLAIFCAVAGYALLRSAASGVSLHALRAAVGGLAVTTALGLALAEGYAGAMPIRLPELTDLHAAWGLGGWALMLLIGVSFTVVPMFQMTPSYPAWSRSWMPAVLATALATASVAMLAPPLAWMWQPSVILALLAAITFALTTVYLQRRRRRRRTDTSFAFSRGAMAALLAAALGCLAGADPYLADRPILPMAIGILCLVGVFVSAICGMLYKIVPFICSIKLPRPAGSTLPPAGIKAFLGERSMNGQMRLHFTALLALLACLFFPQLTRPAGLAFAVSCGWFGKNLLRAVLTYARLANEAHTRADPQAP